MVRNGDVQWSAYSLLLLALCVSGCSRDQGHGDEAATVAMIRRVGGKVEYDGDGPDRRVFKVYLHSTSVQDSDLATLEKLPKLKNLFLGKTKITDAGLEHLRAMTELQTLSLNSTQITDSGLDSLGKLTSLKTLNLQETGTTPAGIALLRKALSKPRSPDNSTSTPPHVLRNLWIVRRGIDIVGAGRAARTIHIECLPARNEP